MKSFWLFPLFLLTACSPVAEVNHGEACVYTQDSESALSLTQNEVALLNAWLRKHCTFSARSLVSYAPSRSFSVDGVTIALSMSDSLLIINTPSGQYVKVRDAEDEAILRMIHL